LHVLLPIYDDTTGIYVPHHLPTSDGKRNRPIMIWSIDSSHMAADFVAYTKDYSCFSWDRTLVFEECIVIPEVLVCRSLGSSVPLPRKLSPLTQEAQSPYPATSAHISIIPTSIRRLSHKHGIQKPDAIRSTYEGCRELKIKCKPSAIDGTCMKCSKKGQPCVFAPRASYANPAENSKSSVSHLPVAAHVRSA
jgi:hypothetical protein